MVRLSPNGIAGEPAPKRLPRKRDKPTYLPSNNSKISESVASLPRLENKNTKSEKQRKYTNFAESTLPRYRPFLEKVELDSPGWQQGARACADSAVNTEA